MDTLKHEVQAYVYIGAAVRFILRNYNHSTAHAPHPQYMKKLIQTTQLLLLEIIPSKQIKTLQNI